jgi:hypothetical protein
MTALAVQRLPSWRLCLCVALCTVLVVLAVAFLPSLRDLLGRVVDWLANLMPHHVNPLWKESPWLS